MTDEGSKETKLCKNTGTEVILMLPAVIFYSFLLGSALRDGRHMFWDFGSLFRGVAASFWPAVAAAAIRPEQDGVSCASFCGSGNLIVVCLRACASGCYTVMVLSFATCRRPACHGRTAGITFQLSP